MKLQKDTKVYVVDRAGMSEMTLSGLFNAMNGGLKLEEVEVFTNHDEAFEANRANARLQRAMHSFSRDEILNAGKLVLLGEDGGVIHEVPFCPTD